MVYRLVLWGCLSLMSGLACAQPAPPPTPIPTHTFAAAEVEAAVQSYLVTAGCTTLFGMDISVAPEAPGAWRWEAGLFMGTLHGTFFERTQGVLLDDPPQLAFQCPRE